MTINIEGMKKAEAMETLIREGYSFAEAEAYWKVNGSAGRGGYTAEFYERLESGPMSGEEFEEWLSGQSVNAQKHRSHFNNIRLMANKIWDNA